MEKDRGMEGNRGQGADAVSNHDERKGESANKTTRGTFRKRNHILNPEPYSPDRMSVYQRNGVGKNQAMKLGVEKSDETGGTYYCDFQLWR